MSSAGIDLYVIAHVKEDFIPLQKMYVIPILNRKICLNYKFCTMCTVVQLFVLLVVVVYKLFSG